MPDRPEPQRYNVAITGDDIARRALNGEPILVYPKGQHHRPTFGGEVRTWMVDDEIIDQLIENYERRADRGIRQNKLPVNEDHKGSRALGWFDRVVKMDEGLGATFTWNPKGRDALENGQFAYFSIEIYDKVVDRVTGETVPNQIAGGALTNYPFFGEAAALMSRSTTQQEDAMPQDNRPPEEAWLRSQFEKLLATFGAQASPGQPPQGGKQDALREDLAKEFSRQMEQAREDMRAEFADQLKDVQEQRDVFARQVETLEKRLTAEQDQRARERYTRMAESYAHVPAQTDDLAAHLRWLHEVDASEGAEHAAFFARLLKKTDDAFKRQFQSLQMRHDASLDSAENQLDDLAKTYARKNDVTYSVALTAVMQERPDLATEYAQEVQHDSGA